MRVWLYLYFTMFFPCLSIGTERGTKFPQIVQKESTAFVQVHNEIGDFFFDTVGADVGRGLAPAASLFSREAYRLCMSAFFL